MATTILMAVISYCAGNINPAILIGRLHGVDIRKEGSGNAGTTNVLRVLGKKAAAATLLVDVLKGFIPVKIGLMLGGATLGSICFACVVLGHIFPALYHFKGGKGVATSLGAALALNWQSALLLIVVAVLLAAVTKYMSVGSIGAAVAYPFLILYFRRECLIVAILMACLVIWMHRANIGRLLRGEESKLSFGSKKTDRDTES
ncbi:MAG: glycerol-3-phosphate 1-O-acyltransferase PlsY [Mogibacterium sp.]|nr:glycerol-3-phosphate 1-O-acyltransferase PlsY [Mogibacterium sp.]